MGQSNDEEKPMSDNSTQRLKYAAFDVHLVKLQGTSFGNPQAMAKHQDQ